MGPVEPTAALGTFLQNATGIEGLLFMAVVILGRVVWLFYQNSRADDEANRSVISDLTATVNGLTTAVEGMLQHQKERDGQRIATAIEEIKAEIRVNRGPDR